MKRDRIQEILEKHRKKGLTLLASGGETQKPSSQLWNQSINEQLLEEIKRDADRFMLTPDPELTYSLFCVYGDTGERLAYERVYFERRKRLNSYVIMALQEPENVDYEVAALNMIWSVCNEFTWCLPAHFNEGSDRLDIDLFSAETGFALSEIKLLLGDRLPDLLRRRIEAEVENRLFRPFLEQGPYGWETADHNWAAVCAGSVGAAALYLIDDSYRLSQVLERVLHSLDCYLSGFGDDGACAEGYLYWQYGFGYYVYFAQILKRATDGEINLFTSNKVKEIALFQQKCFTGSSTVVNFSDSRPESGIFMGLSCSLHQEFAEVIVPDASLGAEYAADHCGRWAPAIRNLMWIKEEWMVATESKTIWPAESYYLSDVQWLLSRHASENGGNYSFAAKGGHNEEPHNHNDVGHFIIHADGQAYLADLGSGKYTAKYFGPERYSIWCNGSQGHSVPIIDGSHQQNGTAFRAAVMEASTNASMDRFALEISSAYGHSKLERLERRFLWEKEKLPRLTLTDAIWMMPKGEESDAERQVTERFISFLVPELAEEGRVILTGQRQLFINYDHQVWKPVVTARSDIDHYGVERFWYTLDFEWKAAVIVPLIANFIFQFES